MLFFLPLSEAYHDYKRNYRNDVFSGTVNEWVSDLHTAIKTDTIHSLAVELFSNDFHFMIGFAKRKNFSKPIDKFRIMCYTVILRIYLLGFPWYDYIIIQHFGFVNTKIQIFVYLFICINSEVSNCGYLSKLK